MFGDRSLLARIRTPKTILVLAIGVVVAGSAILIVRGRRAKQCSRIASRSDAEQSLAETYDTNADADDSMIDEAGRESFPASDPPATNFSRVS